MKKKNPPIYQAILDLPLLKGISLTRITEIVGRYRLNFRKYQSGDVIINAGDSCNELRFVLSGAVRMSVTSPDGNISIVQTLNAPEVICPDRLFGRHPSYPATVTAIETTGIMEIPKEEFRKLLAVDSIVLFNYLNSLCSASQRSARMLDAQTAPGAVKRIAYFVCAMAQPGSTDIHVETSDGEIHSALGISLTSWRAAIERLQKTDAITDVTSTGFRVPLRSSMTQLLF